MEKQVATQLVVLVVRLQRLLDLVLVADIGALHVVGQRLGTHEVVVDGRCHDHVAFGGDSLAKTTHGARHLVDLTVQDHTGELGLRIARNLGRVHVDTQSGAVRRLHIMEGLGNQHRVFCLLRFL